MSNPRLTTSFCTAGSRCKNAAAEQETRSVSMLTEAAKNSSASRRTTA
ncbi:MAG: hypothetical protein MZU97_14730 [Bacillus subtilis]|nr:hypothetical protein [Bacillus subtilis]